MRSKTVQVNAYATSPTLPTFDWRLILAVLGIVGAIGATAYYAYKR